MLIFIHRMTQSHAMNMNMNPNKKSREIAFRDFFHFNLICYFARM